MEEAAYLLQVTTRQVHRYGSEPNARLRTRRLGKRVLFHRADVDALTNEFGAIRKAGDRPPPAPKAELMPVGEMLSYLRERDQQLTEVQQAFNQALLKIGHLQGQLEQRLLPEDAEHLRQRISELEGERERLQRELNAERSAQQQEERAEDQPPRPWWKRLFTKLTCPDVAEHRDMSHISLGLASATGLVAQPARHRAPRHVTKSGDIQTCHLDRSRFLCDMSRSLVTSCIDITRLYRLY